MLWLINPLVMESPIHSRESILSDSSFQRTGSKTIQTYFILRFMSIKFY